MPKQKHNRKKCQKRCCHTDASQLLEIISQLPGIVAWKNNGLQYLGGNEKAAKLSGFKSIDQLIGRDDFQVREKIVECADLFEAQDKRVLNEQHKMSIFGVHQYADGTVRMLYTEKNPLYDQDNNVTGLIFYSNIISHAFLITLGQQLIAMDKRYLSKEERTQNSYLIEDAYNPNLTDKERESRPAVHTNRPLVRTTSCPIKAMGS